MKNTAIIAALGLALVGACKDENPTLGADAKKPDAPGIDAPGAPTYVQIEQLARPGINEVFIRNNADLNGYNATAPAFNGVPTATLDTIIADAEGTMEALYLGVCFVNGAAGLTAASGLKPGGMTCVEVGNAVLNAGGTAIAADALAAAQTYATTVFGQFEPDVMRIDTSKPSDYLTLCGGNGPLLCGGRVLTDDVIDITYDYLLDGANEYLNPTTPPSGLTEALTIPIVSDGVVYDNVAAATDNTDSLSTGSASAANSQQGHPKVLTTFPFSAPPI
jgi:hypothetical protein